MRINVSEASTSAGAEAVWDPAHPAHALSDPRAISGFILACVVLVCTDALSA